MEDVVTTARGGRARSACDLCRYRKIRCDGEKPACENCRFSGVTCTFTFTGQPRKTIREQLFEAKARLRELEGIVAARDPQAVNQTARDGSSSSPSPSLGVCSASPHPHDSSDFDTAMEVFRQHLEYCWPGVAHSPQRASFYSTVYRQTGSIFDLQGFLAGVTQSYKSQHPATRPKAILPKWPTYQLAQQCLDFYSAEGLYSIFPCIDITAAQGVLKELVAERPNADTQARTAEKACLFAFTAFIAKLHPHLPMFADADPDAYVHAVLTLVPRLILEPADVRTLEALLILALYIAPTGQPKSAQLLLSMAVRILYNLGGHRKCPLIENQRAHSHLRAMFWLCYTMDKEMSIRTCSPPLIHDVDCDMEFPPGHGEPPDSPALQNLPSPPIILPSDGRLAMFKAKVYFLLYSNHPQSFLEARRLEHIRQLDQELSELKSGFPLAFPSDAPDSNSPEPNFPEFNVRGVSIYLEYYYCLRKLHEASITSSMSLPWYQNPLPSSLELYYQASRSTLLYYLRAKGLLDTFSFWIHAQFILSAILSLFWYLIQVPTASTFMSDLRILEDTKEMFSSINRNSSDTKYFPPVYIIEAFLDLLISLARQALSKATGAS
ncbi:C6 transcription factor [Aspergillus heteromorphus CBS 117.55]|uniref:C6 transcription factor n=1 Tax=Aspergillus heteromorphus CBS 117.55 TaxID=1448321 RepID=A0A317W7Q0_9EURO|nr:C6 transcription factor [Aspergillus heteromorphus CBS 117.55]PWY81915.1 C6 transcription factor [Aspergillus heteromorphus CBS 117.55]